MSPTLSVITVTKDDPEGLRATLQSLASSSSITEHWIVDGSRDPIPPCASLRFRHVASPPRGIYAAMNEGVARSTGDVLWFLNGGDRLRDPHTLARLLDRFAADPDLDLICAAADLVTDGRHAFVSYPRKTLRRSIVSGRPLCHQAMLFRRRVFVELGPYSESFSIAGDEELVLRIFLAGRKTECVPDRLVYFDTGGLSQKKSPVRYDELARASRALRGRLPWLAYTCHVWHRRWNALRSRAFRRLRAAPGGERLRWIWIGWRRMTLRYR